MGRGKEGKGLVDFLVHTVSVASKLLITGRQEPGNLEREKPTTTQAKYVNIFTSGLASESSFNRVL